MPQHRAPRKPLAQQVMVSHSSGHRLCSIHDISTSGVLLEMGWSALTHDQPVEIVLDLPTNNHVRPFHIRGKVVRVSRDGTAIQFRQFEKGARETLAARLAQAQAHD